MAKITRKKDFPEWFDLQEYQSCNSFIAIDWMVVLKNRYYILECIDHGNIDDAWRFAEKAWKDPANSFHIDWDKPESPVKSMTFSDLAFQRTSAMLLAFAAPEEAEKWVNAFNAIGSERWLHSPYYKEPIDSGFGTSRSLTVNLNASDSVLMDSFSAWLKDARLQGNAGSKRELPAYRSWVRYGLLPYLDLFIWTKLTGNEIPYQVMSDAVGYGKGGDSFRKTVPKLLIELPQLIAELEALATIEHDPERFMT